VSEDRVEVVRATWEALAEGGVEAMLAHIAEDFEMTTPPQLSAEPDTYRGHDGIRRWFDSFYEAVDEIRIEPGPLVPVGDGVATELKLSTRGRTTGIEASQSVASFGRVAGGKVKSLEFFSSWDEALEAGA